MFRHRVRWLVLVVFILAAFGASSGEAAPPKASALPGELAEWVDWVKKVEPEPRNCRQVEGEVTICVWPSYLSLDVGAKGASFVMDVSVFGPVDVELPGDTEHWPQDVEVDGKTRALLHDGEAPRVELGEGRHTLTGSIPWREVPDSLRVPAEVGILNLVVGGQVVPFASRSGVTLSLEGPDGELVLDEPEPEPEPDQPDEEVPDSETLEVSRRLIDGVPLQIVTRVDVHVAGKARELVLPNPMLDGAKVLQVSAPVPVTMGEGGSLVLQVRPGTLSIELSGVLPQSPKRLHPPEHPAPWPDSEVWVWNAAPAGAPSMGQVSLTGARAVDHARTHAPEEWQGGATYRLESGEALQFEVIQRGVSETSTNRLVLHRDMRVDLAGTGWTVIDDIRGEMNTGNRVDLRHGRGVLGSVATNGQPQVITVADDGHAGVEVRGPALDMRAHWRIQGSTSDLPLGAWSEEFDAVHLAFTLPRGWDLLYAEGPGSLGPTWLGAWRPLDLISLLGVVLLIGRIIGPWAGLTALIGLGLAYTRNGDGYSILLALVGVSTVLVLPLRRRQAKGVALALRGGWAVAAFVLGAWVIWRVPAGVAAVWRDGLSGLAHVRLENELETLAKLALVLFAVAGGALAMAVVSARARNGLGRALAAGLTAVLGLGLVTTFLLGRADESSSAVATRSDSRANVDFAEVGAQQEMLAAAPEPEPEPEEEEEAKNDEAGGYGQRHKGEEGRMGKPTLKQAPGFYAMNGPKDALASNDDEDVWGGLTGTEIGEAYGVGGLGLIGTGQGGGGTGEGTLDKDGGSGAGSGSRAKRGRIAAGSLESLPEDRFVAKNVDLPEIEPPAVPQTGEGVPEWSGPRWTMTLDRTVKSDESLTLWLVTPTVSRVLSIVRALALIFLVFALLRAGWLARPEPRRGPSSSTSRLGALGAGLALVLMARTAVAAPPPELLEELAGRVNAERPLAPSPECGTECALVNKLEVSVAGDELILRAEVHMAGPGVWVLPGAVDTWLPRTVEVDGDTARAMAVYQGQLLLHLEPGLHGVELRGLVGAESLDLDLAGAPKHVVVTAEGWTVDGVDENDLAESLHMQRDRGDEAPEAPVDPAAAPQRLSQDMEPWFALERRIQIGPRWTVETTVTRLSHGPSPTKLHVPLLPGEKMLEASAKVDDPKATVTLRAAGESITWTSVLEQSAALELVAPGEEDWTETWVIRCAGAWQCSDQGTPATADSGGTRVFHPWPGEKLQLVFFEPSPAEGQLLTIDGADLHLGLGETGTEARLTMTVRTATVAERTITLPAGAHVGSVQMDGDDVPMAKDATELRLTFQPGLHRVGVEFKMDTGAAAVVRAPVVQLGGSAVNARLSLEYSDASDRVVVWASGEGVGPMVWLWPYFGVLALLSILLARYTRPPLNVAQWFLLNLGFSGLVLPIVWLWFVLVELRERHAARLHDAARYNLVQIALGLLTLTVVGLVLLTAKELLTSPASTIVHNWSEGSQLSWYEDRAEASTPAATVVTMPISLWRAVWAAWVVWLAWSSIAWGKWVWGVASTGGWLRSQPEAAMEEPPVEAPPVEAPPVQAEPDEVQAVEASNEPDSSEPKDP